MTIVIEDGTIVEDANSYVDLDEARAYAIARGVTLTQFDDDLEEELIKAMDYLETFRDSYKGTKTDSAQELQWPRYAVAVDGIAVDSATIPRELRHAQIRLVMEMEAGVELLPTADGSAFVVSEKVGPIETKYSEGVSTSGVAIMRSVEALLAPLLRQSGLLTTARA